MEEAYLDAYEGEGWRGANREKLRPTAELEQARLQVAQCHKSTLFLYSPARSKKNQGVACGLSAIRSKLLWEFAEEARLSGTGTPGCTSAALVTTALYLYMQSLAQYMRGCQACEGLPGDWQIQLDTVSF